MFAFIIANYSSNNLFIANTPKVNVYYIASFPTYITEGINNFALGSKNFFTNLFKPTTIVEKDQGSFSSIPMGKGQAQNLDTILNSSFKNISKGVYAGEYEGSKVYQFVENEIIWKIYTYTLTNGKVITIQVPQGQEPPTQKDIEATH